MLNTVYTQDKPISLLHILFHILPMLILIIINKQQSRTQSHSNIIHNKHRIIITLYLIIIWFRGEKFQEIMLLIEIFGIFWKILTIVLEVDYVNVEVLGKDVDFLGACEKAVDYVVSRFVGVFDEIIMIIRQKAIIVHHIPSQSLCSCLILFLYRPINKYQIGVQSFPTGRMLQHRYILTIPNRQILSPQQSLLLITQIRSKKYEMKFRFYFLKLLEKLERALDYTVCLRFLQLLYGGAAEIIVPVLAAVLDGEGSFLWGAHCEIPSGYEAIAQQLLHIFKISNQNFSIVIQVTTPKPFYTKNYIKMSWRDQPKRRLIMDSGSHTIRIGTASTTVPNFTYLNCIAIDRSSGNKLFGTQLQNIFDETKLIYEKNNVRGVTVKFEPYVTMIDDLMAKMQMPKKTTGFFCEGYSITLPLLPYHPRKIMQRYMQIYLEYLRFDGIYIEPSSALIYDHARALYNNNDSGLGGTKYAISDRYAVVVESSESATYITPFFEGKPVKSAIKRLDVGGKLLTNYLKQILTFRHLDLKNSDQLIKQIKQQMCFVSRNLTLDMRCPRNTFLKHFVMPDDELKKKGYAVDKLDESVYLQHISLDKERFQIPEILFNPQDIGLEQKGIPDAIHECLKFAEPAIRHNYLENIIVTGGNTRFGFFNERLYDELKKNTFNWVTPMIYAVSDLNACYEAAVSATRKANFVQKVILKEEYRDRGPNRVQTVMF